MRWRRKGHSFYSIINSFKKTKGYLTEKYLFTYYFLIITLLFFHPSILRLAYSQKMTFLSLLFLLLNERMQKFEWFHISTKNNNEKVIHHTWTHQDKLYVVPLILSRWCQRDDDGQTWCPMCSYHMKVWMDFVI